MTRAGYVLVGGRSSRMGRDKALLPFRGEPLACSVARQVELAAGSVVLVGDPDLYGSLRYPVIPDAFPGEGPLSGILTALRHTSSEWNLVVACDMPELTADFLSNLLAVAEVRQTTVVPQGPSGRLEPLCIVWRRSALPAVEAAFQAGVRKVAAALADLAVTVYPVTEVAPFQNVNTLEEWNRHAAK